MLTEGLSLIADHHSLPLFQLAEEYGPVFTLHFGFQKVVVLTGYEVVREALVNYTEEFVDRPSIPIFDQIQNGNGTRAMRGGGRDGAAQCQCGAAPSSPALKSSLDPPYTDGIPSLSCNAFPLSLYFGCALAVNPYPLVEGRGVGFLKAQVCPFIPMPGIYYWIQSVPSILSPSTKALSLDVYSVQQWAEAGNSFPRYPCGFPKDIRGHPALFLQPGSGVSSQKAALYAGHRPELGLQLEIKLPSHNIKRRICHYTGKRN